MAVNKVEINGQTVIDLTQDTVTPESLGKGITAHDKSGAQITGTLEASSSGGAKETWVLDSTASYNDLSVTFNANFTSNGLSFSSIKLSASLKRQIRYDSTVVKAFDSWTSEAYRKLTFAAPPTGDLLTWLQNNGVKQPDDIAVQDTKAVIITSNGTVSVAPDAPYDALKKVDVSVDMASGGIGYKVTFPAEAAKWGMVDTEVADIFLADGTTKSVIDYSTIGGKTVENVTGIRIFSGNSIYVLRMTLSAGRIAQFQINVGVTSYAVTTAPNATATPYSAGRSLFWWPIEDTVISYIEMYNTD